jgi:hypothetical protein
MLSYSNQSLMKDSSQFLVHSFNYFATILRSILLRSVSVRFHEDFHDIKYVDVAKKENVRVS